MRFDESNKYFLSSGVERGYRWVVLHNGMGYRCGYVCVTPNHPWWKKGYDEISATCHGGLTFTSEGDIPGEWWVGFDCGHGGDAPDPSLPSETIISFLRIGFETIKTQEYVEKQCKKLCKQADKASNERLFPFYEVHYGKVNNYAL